MVCCNRPQNSPPFNSTDVWSIIHGIWGDAEPWNSTSCQYSKVRGGVFVEGNVWKPSAQQAWEKCFGRCDKKRWGDCEGLHGEREWKMWWITSTACRKNPKLSVCVCVCVGWGEVAERKSQRLNSTKHERPRCVYLIPYGQVASIKAILQDSS